MADWTTISSLATAGGTLVLAVATFSAVRSSNRAGRSAERALQLSLRPVLVPSRLEDAPEKVGFQDNHWMRVEGGRVGIDVSDDAIYFVLPLRNVGNGLAVLDRWEITDRQASGVIDHGDVDNFRRLTRDLYVAGGDRGYWQGALRDRTDPLFGKIRAAIDERRPMTLELLYGDHDGGQRTITRFSFVPFHDDVWLASSSRYWYLDHPDVR